MRMKEAALWFTITTVCGLLTFCSCLHVQRSMNAWADNVSISGANIADNTLPVAKIQSTGTKSSSTFLRGDGYWGVVPSGGTGPQGPTGPAGSFDDNGTLNINNFPADLRPIKVVDNVLAVSCGSDNTYVEGSVAYDKLTYKLYRCASDNNWKTFVDNTDIQGLIGDNLIAAMDAAKLAGQITETQIADNAITTPKLVAGVINSATLLSGKIITNSFIADNTITNSLIADNAIVRGAMIADNIITNNMLVGSIAASKLAVDNLSAITADMGLLTAGTIQQSYTAPGDDNTTPGAGLKITGGSIEAYGDTQTFGGTIVVSDNNLMVSIGKGLTATGLTKRYPLNNATNFTSVTGNTYFYSWETTGWVLRVSIGASSAVRGTIISATNPSSTGNAINANSYNTTGAGAVQGNANASGGSGVYGYNTTGEGVGVKGESYEVGTTGYGGYFRGSAAPVYLYPSNSSAAPTNVAYKGSLWVTSDGILYINTAGDNTWQKVGAQ